MKYHCFLIALIFAFLFSNGQDSAMAEWQLNSLKKSDNVYTLSFKANIHEGWRIFSTKATDEEPNTRIVLDSSTSSFASIETITEKGNLQTI